MFGDECPNCHRKGMPKLHDSKLVTARACQYCDYIEELVSKEKEDGNNSNTETLSDRHK
jgi:Zn ribbon nucleic-acid-binding protein